MKISTNWINDYVKVDDQDKVELADKITNAGVNVEEVKEYNKDILESAIVYDDIYRQPNRKKCALLSWWGIEKIINKGE